jgi:hypothetical protein
VEAADFESKVNFGNQISLIGYDLPKDPATPGDALTITAYWKSQQAIDINYQVFVHLLDTNNNLVAQSDKLNPGDFPTRRWPLDKYVRDVHHIELPQGLQPGNYRWSIGLWVASDGWRLPLLGENGEQVSDSFIIPELLELE